MKRARTALCCVLTACGRGHAAPPADAAADARISAEWMAEAVRPGSATPACGTTAYAGRPALAVLVSANQALSCRDLGYLLRRLHPAADGKPAWIVVPARDTAAVCRFLREERVRLPVFTAPDTTRARRGETRVLAAARLDAAGRPSSIHHGAQGADVLASLDASAPALDSSLSPTP